VRLLVEPVTGTPFVLWAIPCRPVAVSVGERTPEWRYELTFARNTLPDPRTIRHVTPPDVAEELARFSETRANPDGTITIVLRYDRPAERLLELAGDPALPDDAPRFEAPPLIMRRPARTHDNCHHEGRLVPAAEHRRRHAQEAALIRAARSTVPDLSTATGAALDREAELRGLTREPVADAHRGGLPDRLPTPRPDDRIAQFISDLDDASEAWEGGYPTLGEARAARAANSGCLPRRDVHAAAECRLQMAATSAVGIACEHGFDVCPTCDPCTCGRATP